MLKKILCFSFFGVTTWKQELRNVAVDGRFLFCYNVVNEVSTMFEVNCVPIVYLNPMSNLVHKQYLNTEHDTICS